MLQTHIGYGTIQYKSNNNKTNANIGFRANYFTKFDKIQVEPRLSLHQDLGSGLAVQVLGEFKSQTTTQRIDFESDFLGVEKRRWVLANDETIPVINSKQISMGFEYN